MRRLIEEAANNSSEGITISSMSGEDRPLIFVNAGFERITGYAQEEAVGRNCRFLQGEDTDQSEVDKIRSAIRNGEECTVVLKNYKKDGTPFWNRLSISPIYDRSRNLTHYVGIQSDITELRETRQRLEEANLTLEQFRTRITRELEQARNTQEFLLPSHLPRNAHVKFAGKFVPMEEVGGDYYDVLEIGPGVYGMLVADVTGHGIPAALLTFMASTTFKNAAPEHLSTADTISETNKRLYRKMPDDSFVTMFYVVLDSESGQITYTQAGHPAGILLRPGTGEVFTLSTGGTLVGPFSQDEIEFSEKRQKVRQGDKVILYTDAVSDAMDMHPEIPGRELFHSFLVENSSLPLEQLFDKVYVYGLSLSGQEKYADDFTMVGFEVQ